MHKIVLIAAALLSAYTAQAEIQEISQQEMTDTHIRDTTVIIPKRATPTEPKAPIHVKITPIDQTELDSLPDTTQGNQNRPDLTPLTDTYLSEQRERSLLQQQSNVPSQLYDASRAERERNLNNIWQQFNLQGDIPNDYRDLTFPTNVEMPAGSNMFMDANQFSISIPNTGDYRPSTQKTPNGEYQVDITPDNIKFIINLPKNN